MNLKILTTEIFFEKLGYEASPMLAGFIDVFFCGDGVPDVFPQYQFSPLSVFKCQNISSQFFVA